jgi:DNA-directed RNA polymerase subunit F
MEVKDPRCTFLTNREVLSVLEQSKPSKQKHMRKHNTIIYEATKFLKSTPAKNQNETDVQKLMSDLQTLFKLKAAEILQIVNLRPTSSVELAMIIEESKFRVY